MLKLNKRRIDAICLSISFSLVICLTIVLILAMADGIFGWDILPKNLEKVATLIMLSTGLIIVSSFLISLMVNMSLISGNIEKIAHQKEKGSYS